MSNLLQKASIITTPTAYDTGKILSVKPVETYGPELITNGDFATDSDWTKGPGWSISGGAANASNSISYNRITQDGAGVNTTTLYKLTFTVFVISGGMVPIVGSKLGSPISVSGTYTQYLTSTAATTLIQIASNPSFTGSIDNVSVKEVFNADFDFTRNSSATRVGSNGLIQDVASNLPRIDYTGGVGSWKFEPQRTNLIPYSESFSNSDWTKSNATITGNSIISPDGTLNASKLTENTVNSNHRISDTIVVSGTGVAYTQSIFAKSGGNGRFLRISRGSGTYNFAVFDLENGVVVSQGGSRIISTKIEKYPNGWYRCISTFTTQFSNIATYYGLQNGNLDSYTGDGTSGLYIFGAMLEEGSYSTSIIPTSGSATTRLADVANNAGSSDLINSTEGVLYAEISAFDGAGGGTRRIELSNGVNASQYVRLQIANGDGSLYANITNNIGQQVLFNYTSFNATLSNKIVLKYKQNDFSLFVNGFKIDSSNVGNTFANGVLTQANFSSTASEFYGNTKCIAVFKEALTDLELECLSSWMSFSDMGIALGYTVE